MKQNIERTYVFSAAEIKQILQDHLKALDRPFPKYPSSLTVTWNADGDVNARFFEVLDFDKPKASAA